MKADPVRTDSLDSPFRSTTIEGGFDWTLVCLESLRLLNAALGRRRFLTSSQHGDFNTVGIGIPLAGDIQKNLRDCTRSLADSIERAGYTISRLWPIPSNSFALSACIVFTDPETNLSLRLSAAPDPIEGGFWARLDCALSR